jgi:hypothetical protein
MQVIGLFAVFVGVLDAIAIAICSVVESYSENASLLVFLALYAGNFIIAWKTALYLTERYLVTDTPLDQRDHARAARSTR